MHQPTLKHGAERNCRIEHERVNSGMGFGLIGYTATVSEKWCAKCGWVEVRGVMGALRFMAEHDAHREGV